MLQKILMVEDEGDIQQIARFALEMVGGFTVEMCSSGDEALQTAPAFAPDLILLDVMMPSMDGPTTLSKLREIPSLTNTTVVFITAKVQPDEIGQYRALGAADVISKPFDPMTLSDKVRAVHAQATAGATPAPAAQTST
ncbi:MAG TPA: response regulator [Abditibacteriaceae bacterium]|jgi:CheY-like chemotaxis protein